MVFDKFRVMVVNSWCLLVLVFNAGNSDALGTELLESLLKMAPTKEEERKLKEYKDDSPVKLGTAEKFLKELLDVPFAFKRVEAMLYMTNFESEIDYLKKSFETLDVNHTSHSLSLSLVLLISFPLLHVILVSFFILMLRCLPVLSHWNFLCVGCL